MKRLMCLTMCLCTMLLVMTACSGKNNNSIDKSILGKWEQTVEENGSKVVSVYEFDESGKLSQTVSIKRDSPAMNIYCGGTVDYTYENNIITFKFDMSNFEIKEFQIEGLDEEELVAAMEQYKENIAGTKMEQQLRDVKINGDEMTAIFNGMKITLKRI